ncbi:MAG TPA: hypothetical protein VFJ47_11995, partial [Terriglobales bacterium]|nr:hypothetical protein [Terriglobales bacterium]
MRLRVLSFLLLVLVASQFSAQTASKLEKFSPPSRTFRFTYNFTLKEIPAQAKRVRVWIPVPQTDQHQKVRVVAVKAPAKMQPMQEPEYGNRMLYAEFQASAEAKPDFTVEYEIT